MTYQETLDWLFQQLASFQRVGQSAYKEDLGNITALCSSLNNPQTQFKSIHIAGTNGKGSTSHFLASILQEQGYKVGLYTSPHLKDFRERVKINGGMISEEEVVRFVEKHRGDFLEIGASFFEMTTTLAFDYFSNHKVDIAIIETGLGGRLDATNIICPELSIITNVALDHQNLLGNTIEEIAVEKAGIIKNGVPVILGKTTKEVKRRVEGIAFERKSNFIESVTHTNYRSALSGNCQKENVATVCTAIEQLRVLGWNIIEEALQNGLLKVVENTNLRGRWECISEMPKTICDTGHNVHAVKSIVNQLASEDYENLWIVIGMVGDKDVDAVLSLLPKMANYVFCAPAIPRALSANILEQKAAVYSLNGVVVEKPAEALAHAQSLANENDLIFVGGSTFVVAEIL